MDKLNFVAQDAFKQWWEGHFRKLYDYALYSKCAAVWNAALASQSAAQVVVEVTDEREAFGKEFAQHNLDMISGAYVFKYVQHAWEGWQARAAQEVKK